MGRRNPSPLTLRMRKLAINTFYIDGKDHQPTMQNFVYKPKPAFEFKVSIPLRRYCDKVATFKPHRKICNIKNAMSKVILAPQYLASLAELDQSIYALNKQKTAILFEALKIRVTPQDLAAMLEWELILVAVPDKQMAVQLNKYSAYVPHLKFIVAVDQRLFALSQGIKARRVWKER